MLIYCPSCDKHFKSINQHANQSQTYHCHICLVEFPRFRTLRYHIYNKHNQIQSCPHPGCIKSFTLGHYVSHKLKYHSGQSFLCDFPECQYEGSQSKSHYYRHIKLVHRNEKRNGIPNNQPPTEVQVINNLRRQQNVNFDQNDSVENNPIPVPVLNDLHHPNEPFDIIDEMDHDQQDQEIHFLNNSDGASENPFIQADFGNDQDTETDHEKSYDSILQERLIDLGRIMTTEFNISKLHTAKIFREISEILNLREVFICQSSEENTKALAIVNAVVQPIQDILIESSLLQRKKIFDCIVPKVTSSVEPFGSNIQTDEPCSLYYRHPKLILHELVNDKTVQKALNETESLLNDLVSHETQQKVNNLSNQRMRNLVKDQVDSNFLVIVLYSDGISMTTMGIRKTRPNNNH